MTLFQTRTLRLREAQSTHGHGVRTLKSRLPVPAPCLTVASGQCHGVACGPLLVCPSLLSHFPGPLCVACPHTLVALGRTRAVSEDTFCLLCGPGLGLSLCSLPSHGDKGHPLCYCGK